jgi:hypothetical protein
MGLAALRDLPHAIRWQGQGHRQVGPGPFSAGATARNHARTGASQNLILIYAVSLI